MKARYIFFAVAAVVISACSIKKEPAEVVSRHITIKAIQEGYDGLTKTAVIDGGQDVYWEPNDDIKVFYAGSGSRFVSNNSELAGVAKFTGTLSAIIGFNEGFSNDNPLWGLYPYRADATSDGASVTTTLPEKQTGRAGSFATHTHITLGCSTSLSMGFYSVCGGLRFSLTQDGIKSVTFEGNNGEALAGKIKLAFSGGVPVVQEVSAPQTKITLTAPSGETFQTGQWYYIEAIPGTLSKGFKMVFSKGNESATIISSGSVTISRGKYGSLADVGDTLVFNDEGGNDENNDETSLDISLSEAGTLINQLDANNLSIIRELKLSGELNGTDIVVIKRMPNLYLLDISESSIVEGGNPYYSGYKTKSNEIGDYMFFNLPNLKIVRLPNNITRIGNNAFNSTPLEDINLPDGITYIGTGSLYGSHFSELILPSELKELGSQAFAEAQIDTYEVTIPEGVEKIGSLCFSSVTTVHIKALPSTLKRIELYAVGYDYSSVTVYVPKGTKNEYFLTELGNYPNLYEE